MSFSLFAVIADAFRKHQEKTGNGSNRGRSVNAIAIHGRPGARVALLQSPVFLSVLARPSKILNVVSHNNVATLN